jgi:hypothetical protein
MGEITNAHKISTEKLERKKSVGKPKSRWTEWKGVPPEFIRFRTGPCGALL